MRCERGRVRFTDIEIFEVETTLSKKCGVIVKEESETDLLRPFIGEQNLTHEIVSELGLLAISLS